MDQPHDTPIVPSVVGSLYQYPRRLRKTEGGLNGMNAA